MKKTNINILLLILAISIIVFSIIWAGGAEFGGTDNKATALIEETNYKPWFDYIFAPSPVVENFLFSLQAAIGAGALFYFIGYFVGKKSKNEAEPERE